MTIIQDNPGRGLCRRRHDRRSHHLPPADQEEEQAQEEEGEEDKDKGIGRDKSKRKTTRRPSKVNNGTLIVAGAWMILFAILTYKQY
jgi:hypothetical protein